MEEFLFPILTGLTLVFAGILVGYFIWFRDRGDQLLLSEQLATDNERMNAELSSHTALITDLNDQTSRLELKNTSLQQLCDDLMASREKTQLRAADLENELNSARTRLDESREQLTAESRGRAKLEESLHQLKQEYMDSVAQIESQWKEKSGAVENSLHQVKAESARLLAANESITEKLHHSNSECARYKSELDAQREILDTAKSNAAGLEKEYVSLESSMRSQIELVNEARGKAAAALSAQHLAEEALSAKEKQLKEFTQQSDILQAQAAEAESLRSRCEHLEMSIQLGAERIESLVGQRDDSLQKQQDLRQEADSLRLRADNQQTALEQLRAQAQATEQRRQKNHTGLINQIQELETAQQNWKTERDQLLAQLEISDEISRQSEGLANQVRQLESANAELMQKCTDLSSQIESAEDSKHRSDESIKKISEENALLVAKLSEFEKFDPENLISSDEYRHRISSVLEQRDSAFDQLKELKAEIKRLQQHSKTNEETIRTLRRERGAILMRNRESVTQFPRIHNESLDFKRGDELASEYGGTTTLDPVRGHVFVEAPRRHDDLKLIHGVAKVLERKLNGYGVYTFKQIMEWDDTAIEEFSELLVFKDRIHRDDWQGQAARLYYRKNRNQAA